MNTSSNHKKHLHEVLRVLSARSSKRRKLPSDEEKNNNDSDFVVIPKASPSSEEGMLQKQAKKDRFVKLASSVLYTDSSRKMSLSNQNDEKKQQDFLSQDSARYEQLLKQEEEEIERVKAARKRIRQEQVELWNVYKFGLQKIMQLNDLSEAPDAILPGNFG
jgi:hypothetical protein